MKKPSITETDELQAQILVAPKKLQAYVRQLERDVGRLQSALGKLEAENFVLKSAALGVREQHRRIRQELQALEAADATDRAGKTEVLGKIIFGEDW